VLSHIRGVDDDQARMFDPATTTPTNLPTNAIRWNGAQNRFEKWNGTTWGVLTSALNMSAEWAAETVEQAEAEAGTATTRRAWTAQRVRQAIAAWWSGITSNPVALSSNSTSPTLTITQTGTGSALVVNDAAGDTTPFVIDAEGRVINGHTASLLIGGSSQPEQIYGDGGVGVSLGRFGANAFGPDIRFFKSRSGTIGGSAIVQNNDTLGNINFFSDDGADDTRNIACASISSQVDGVPSAGDVPGRLIFRTRSPGGSITERVRINSAGLVSLQNDAGLQIVRTGVTSPAASDGNVFSGTYTPTLTNTTNVAASTAATCQYMRVGAVVTVSGAVRIDPTATGNTILGMSLPIASPGFDGQQNLGGSFATTREGFSDQGSIKADSTNKRALFQLNAVDTSLTWYAFSFTYRVM
jgi:hypothetical protein